MANYYLDMLVTSRVEEPFKKDSALLMLLSGANIGNYAFRHALSSMVDMSDAKLANYQIVEQDLAKGAEIDSAVLSCANWLCASDHYEKSNGVRAATLEKIQGKLLPVGLGAQSASGSSELKLGPNTERLAKVLSEKSELISVRDEKTADVLNKIGIHNFIITGCPSNFINMDPNLGAKVQKKAAETAKTANSWRQIRAHISEVSGGHAKTGPLIKATIKQLKDNAAFYVLQTPNLLPFLLREEEKIHPAYASNCPEGVDQNILKWIFKRTLIHYSSIESWMDFCRTCDLAYGMRIHGNMIPLQSGVPSIVVVHDSRTVGLTEFMGIPRVSPEEFLDYCDKTPAPLFDNIAETLETYDTQRVKISEIWVKYWQSNGVDVNRDYVDFSQGRSA